MPGKVILREAAMESERCGAECKSANDCCYQCQDVSLSGRPVHVHVYAIATKRKADKLRKVIPTALDINIGAVFHAAVLVDFENLADPAATSQLRRNQISLNRPSTHGGWIVADNQNFACFYLRFRHRDVVGVQAKASEGMGEGASARA